MKKRISNKSGKVKELKQLDIDSMRSAKEVLPAKLLHALSKRKRGERGAQKAPKKIPVTVRYSPEVVRYFKSTGDGWQTRIDGILRKYIKSHPINDRSKSAKKIS